MANSTGNFRNGIEVPSVAEKWWALISPKYFDSARTAGTACVCFQGMVGNALCTTVPKLDTERSLHLGNLF